MAIWKKITDTLDRYLKRLSRENLEMFGSGRLDCCTLDRKQAPQTPPEKK